MHLVDCDQRATWKKESTSVTLFFFFNDTATTEIYTLSLHDALPISVEAPILAVTLPRRPATLQADSRADLDRKSTRLNSSHLVISYAVFCLKKKKPTYETDLVFAAS